MNARRRAQAKASREKTGTTTISIPGDLATRIEKYTTSAKLPIGAAWSVSAIAAAALDAWLTEKGY